MSDVSKFVIGQTTINVKDTTARYNASSNANSIGDLTTLTTTDKSNLVDAINEVNGNISTPAYTAETETISL